MMLKELCCFCRRFASRVDDATFSIDDQISWRSEYLDPATLNCLANGGELLGGYLFTIMPPVASVYHMPDCMAFVKQDIGFHLFVWTLSKLDAWRNVRFAAGPGSALSAGVNDIGNHVEDSLWNSCGFERSLHRRSGGVPPADM